MNDVNPRYPHSLTVKRVKRTNGEIVFDVDGNVTYETVTLSVVALDYRGFMLRSSEGVPVIASAVSSIPCGYRSVGRESSTSGDAVVASRLIHTPPFTTELLFDDLLEITDYDRSYKARLVKKQTGNMGTAIWFDEIKN